MPLPSPLDFGNRPVAINSFSGGLRFSRNRQPTAARGPPPKAYRKERSMQPCSPASEITTKSSPPIHRIGFKIFKN